MVKWRRTAPAHPGERSVHELFEAQVARTPNARALVCDSRALSYAELNARANQLAHYLRQRGVKPEVRVGVCLERSLDLVVALLGILKAGGCYVPLETSYPAERLAFMLADSRVTVLVTREGVVELQGSVGHQVLDLSDNTLRQALAAQPANNLAPARIGLEPENLAYLMYTSGSTGQPKGVMITHAHYVRRPAICEFCELTSSD